MPNADTLGSIYRKALLLLKDEFPDRFLIIENFGKENYFSAMYYSKFLLGNTSSGIIEAPAFNVTTLNVGERQSGRYRYKSIIDFI